MKNSKWMRLAAGGVLPALLTAALSGCGGSRDPDKVQQNVQKQIKGEADAAKKQLSELHGVKMNRGELSGGDAQGRPLWRISAAEIRVFNQPAPQPLGSGKNDTGDGKSDDKSDGKYAEKIKALSAQPRRAELKDAKALLYKNGKIDSTFRAPRAIVNYAPSGARIIMMGGISAQSQGGWTGKRGVVALTAPRAEVNVKTRKLWASGGVRLMQGVGANRIFASANQMQADTSLKTTRLIGSARASSSTGKFSAQQAAWNWETHRASAQGEVTATHEGTTISGARLMADADNGRGVLTGGVRASGEQGKATASSASYDWKNHRVVASGGVVLIKGDSTMQAGQLSADDKFNSATASGSVTLKKGDATLRASQIQTQGKGETATASGGVVLIKGDAQISSSRATAYNMGADNASVRASGEVRVKRGEVTITAGAAEATGLKNKNALRVAASDGVYASSKDGAVRAGRATWGAGQIVASSGVTLYRDGHELSGSRLVCDDKFTVATLTGDINGRLAKGGTIAAGRMTYRKGQGVVASDGVSARRGELRLRADNMTSTPDGNHLLLTGHVVVINEDGARILAPQARYDRVAQKIYASGDVYLQDPKRGLRQRGRHLVADLKLNQATLTDVSGSGKMDVFKDKKLF